MEKARGGASRWRRREAVRADGESVRRCEPTEIASDGGARPDEDFMRYTDRAPRLKPGASEVEAPLRGASCER
jgi:hypothetical protein